MRYNFAAIRQLRQEQKLTLEELARRAGLTYSTVALVETNKAFPSLKTLDALAESLGIPSSRLLKMAEPGSALVRQVSDMAEGHPLIVGGGRGKAAEFEELKVYHVQVEKGQEFSPQKPHENCLELFYVTAGQVQVGVKRRRYELEAGQAIVFDGTAEHFYATGQGCEALVVHLPKSCREVERLLENGMETWADEAEPVGDAATTE